MAWILLGAAAVAVLVVAIVVVWRRRRSPELVSIVMLRRRPRNLTEADVRGAARRVLSGGDIDVRSVAVNESTSSLVVLLGGAPVFYIIESRETYNGTEEAPEFEDPRSRAAYAEHRAWLSVDVVGGMPPAEIRSKILGAMGRLAAEFFDDDCTLLCATAIDRVALPGPGLEAALTGGDPMSAFGDDEVNIPIFNVESGDRRIEGAVRQARREWPRFVEVWGRRGSACNGLVKGKFTVGADGADGAEYMWIEVSRLEKDRVRGVLLNAPAHVKGLKKGQDITIPVSQVVDWACIDNGEPLGMFVERILTG